MLDQDDTQLMLWFQRERATGAFEELFRRNKDPLLRFLWRLSGSLTIAEDVSQQAWLKVIDVARQGLYKAEPGVTYRTWLCTLGRNHFIDEYQRKMLAKRTVPLPEEHSFTPPNLTAGNAHCDDVIYKQQRSSRLRRALQALPHEQRDVISLWATGVAIGTIAKMTAAPRDTVLSRKKYAIAHLRSMLSTAISDPA